MSLVTKDSIIQACADAYKEGTGVDSVKVGELAVKILEAISFGGSSGLPLGMAIGEFVPQDIGGTSKGDFTVEHGLGKTPNYVFGWFNNYYDASMVITAFAIIKINEYAGKSVIFVPGSGSIQILEGTMSVGLNETTFTVPAPPVDSSAMYIPVAPIKWIAIVKEA